MFHKFKRTLPRTGETQEIQIYRCGNFCVAEEWLTKPLTPVTFLTTTHDMHPSEALELIDHLPYHGFKEMLPGPEV